MPGDQTCVPSTYRITGANTERLDLLLTLRVGPPQPELDVELLLFNSFRPTARRGVREMNRTQSFYCPAEGAKPIGVGGIVSVDVDAVANECGGEEAVAVDPQLSIFADASNLEVVCEGKSVSASRSQARAEQPSAIRTCIRILSECPQIITVSGSSSALLCSPPEEGGMLSRIIDVLPRDLCTSHSAAPERDAKKGASTPSVIAPSRPTGDGALMIRERRVQSPAVIALFQAEAIAVRVVQFTFNLLIIYLNY